MDSPAAFTVAFSGPEGEYSLTYTPDGDNNVIEVTMSGIQMTWNVEVVELGPDSVWEIEGLTRGTKSLWGDVYWFTLYCGAQARIEYYGNQVLWRTDRSA